MVLLLILEYVDNSNKKNIYFMFLIVVRFRGLICSICIRRVVIERLRYFGI